MVLKEKSYPNFRALTSSTSSRKISQYCKSTSRIKSKVPLFKNLILEDADFVKRFGEEACKWLSSGTSSLENINFSLLSDPSMDEWLYFLLSLTQNPSLLANKFIACFDGSRVNPIEEAYLVMKKTLLESDTSRIFQEYVKKGDEDEVVAWLSSTRSDATNSIASCSSQNCRELRKHFLLSLVNLDEESCWWDSDTDSDEFLSSSSTCSMSRTVTTSSSDCASEDLNLGELGFNGPIVWPFDKIWNWRDREGKWDDFFVMSPCRQKHTRVQKDIKREPKNKHSKPIDQVNEIRKTNATFRGMMGLKSRKVSLKVVPVYSTDFTIESTPDDNVPGKCKTLEDEFFYLCEKHTIESLLGLEEFNGQEGIEIGLWKDDDFYLQDSL